MILCLDILGWIKYVTKIIFTYLYVFLKNISTRNFRIIFVDNIPFILARVELDIALMKWLETLGRSYLSYTSTLVVAVWLGLPGAVLAHACCSGIIINSVPTNSPRCSCVDDKLCGTLHCSPIVTFIVCSAIKGVVFQGSPGNKTTALTSGYAAERALCSKGLSPGSTMWSLQIIFRLSDSMILLVASSTTSATPYVIPVIW